MKDNKEEINEVIQEAAEDTEETGEVFEENQQDTGYGSVKISDEVISVVTTMAASEVAGVHSMSGTLTNGIVEFLGGKKSPSKGIKVSTDDAGSVTLDIHVTVTYGFKIPDVAWEIQEKVKSAVESITGMTVVKVNVHVDGVFIEKKKAEPEEEPEDIEE